jgi:hypothetical protein
MEHFHSQIVETILQHPDDGIAVCLPEEGGVRAGFLAQVRDIILATDMAQHKALTGDFVAWVDELVGEPADKLVGKPADKLTTEKCADKCVESVRIDAGSHGSSLGSGLQLNKRQRTSLLMMTIKCADLSGVLVGGFLSDARHAPILTGSPLSPRLSGITCMAQPFSRASEPLTASNVRHFPLFCHCMPVR